MLGADDKAGVAEIVSCLEYLFSHSELKHPAIEVIFSPDEETGHGMDKVPLELLKSKCAYTVDGGHIGELETGKSFKTSKMANIGRKSARNRYFDRKWLFFVRNILLF